MADEFTLLACALAVVFSLSYASGALLERARIPGVIAPLLLGFLLKYSPFMSSVMRGNVPEYFSVLGDLAVVFLLFFVGLKIDIAEVRKLSKVIVLVTVLNTFFAFLFNFGVGLAFGYSIMISFLIGITGMPTAEAVVVPILDEFGMIVKKAGQLIIGAGTLDDILEVLIVAFVSILIGQESAEVGVKFAAWGMIVFALTAFLLRKYLLKYLFTIFPHAKDQYRFLLMLAVLFLLSFIASKFELGLVVGAIIAGMVLQPFFAGRTSLESSIRTMAYGFFAPIFFFWVGIQADAASIMVAPALTILLFLAAFIGKFFGVYLLTVKNTLTRKEAITVGVGLNPRLTTDLIVIQILFSAHFIDRFLYTALAARAALATLTVPLLLTLIIRKWGDAL